MLRLVRKVVPSTNDYDGQKLFTKRTGRMLATPLFAGLILVETTDVVFAVDSIPAILAVSRWNSSQTSPSNAFAILRSALAPTSCWRAWPPFRYLNHRARRDPLRPHKARSSSSGTTSRPTSARSVIACV